MFCVVSRWEESLWSSVCIYSMAQVIFTCFLKPWCSWSVPFRVSLPSLQNWESKTAENEKSEFTHAHKYERRNKVTSSLARHTFASDYMTLLASNFPWIRKTINPITPRENWRAGLGGNLLRSYGVLRERGAEFCGAGYISTHSNSFMASEQKEQSLCGL